MLDKLFALCIGLSIYFSFYLNKTKLFAVYLFWLCIHECLFWSNQYVIVLFWYLSKFSFPCCTVIDFNCYFEWIWVLLFMFCMCVYCGQSWRRGTSVRLWILQAISLIPTQGNEIFHIFTLLSRQRAAFSFTTQHATPNQVFGGIEERS